MFSAVFGQTEKGKFLVGAGTNLNYSYTELGFESDDSNFKKSSDTSNYNASLSGGYFIENNLLIGTSLNLGYSEVEFGNSDTKTKTIVVNPFLRYYFGKTTTKYFLNAGIGFGNTRIESTSFDVDNRLFTYQLGGGASVFIAKNISIDLKLEYSYSSVEDREDNPNNFKSVIKGVNSTVGFSFYL